MDWNEEERGIKAEAPTSKRSSLVMGGVLHQGGKD